MASRPVIKPHLREKIDQLTNKAKETIKRHIFTEKLANNPPAPATLTTLSSQINEAMALIRSVLREGEPVLHPKLRHLTDAQLKDIYDLFNENRTAVNEEKIAAGARLLFSFSP